ncbi:MAG: SAM-dependent methyltransferase [Actinobacteria bacterium]|nr:SAM-dependent methyltransferase [Actinomycetota bacterium]
MKTADQLTADKLRGGFYSPPRLVQACLDRVAALTDGQHTLRILEPSAGDGAFVRGLAGHDLAARVDEVTAVEINVREAAKCRAALDAAPFPGTVIHESVLNGARIRLGTYNAAVGNPPFVRFQFLTPEDRAGALKVAGESGLILGGVSNLWIPVLLSALTRLTPGGVFAFIVPAECLTGISAGNMRVWLMHNVDFLQIDLFPPGSFPAVLQEVVVLSGRAAASKSLRCMPALHVVEHGGKKPLSWTHVIKEGVPTWTRYLLTPAQLAALDEAVSLPHFYKFSEVARLTVSTVTGANEYFSVDDATRAAYGLDRWVLPLLPRIRAAAGLVFDENDHEKLGQAGCRRWLLNFAAGLPDPESHPLAYRYLRAGEAEQLHIRYKCRIREPWYRVPVIKPGSLLLSKRSHRYPRLVLNAAQVVTTDTIYQGRMTTVFGSREADLVAGFHNTVTFLTAEIEGRSFGGGVLELVPTEIGRLCIPLISGFGNWITDLDTYVRTGGTDPESLVERTDILLSSTVPDLTSDILGKLREARMSLLKRRMDRTGPFGT